MITKILIVLAVIAVVLVAVIATRPSEFYVERSAQMSASPAAVFAHVNDLHKWQEFSPWAKMDPNAKIAFEGPPAGVGAAFSWSGNNQIGEGRMTIIENRPHEFVRFRLDFVKPFEGTSFSEFTIKPEGDQTRVTWSMSGKNNFVGKAVGLIMDCDAMIGGQFEEGLENLRRITGVAKDAGSKTEG